MREIIYHDIADFFDAECKILYTLTADDRQITDAVVKLCKEKQRELIHYDSSRGFYNVIAEEKVGDTFAEVVSQWLNDSYLNGKVVILHDFHFELDDFRSVCALKNIARESQNTIIIIISNVLNLPAELEHYVSVYEPPSMTKEEIEVLLKRELGTHWNDVDGKTLSTLALGLNEMDILNGIREIGSKGLENKQKVTVAFAKQKARMLDRTKILTMVNDIPAPKDLGGYQALKSWLQTAKSSINTSYFPKGMMLVGVTGCGKSLCAKVAAGILDLPLFRLEFGKILDKYVGGSEQKMDRALRIVEAMAPCVLWLDEFEKAIGGPDSSENNINQRLLGTMLTWMQEKQAAVFIVATVNNISKLPAELLRRGRFDKIYYVDLPTDDERRDILKIHLTKNELQLQDEKLGVISGKLDSYSGADIEFILRETKRRLNAHDSAPAEDIIARCIQETPSVSQMLFEDIDKMRREFTQRHFENVNGRVVERNSNPQEKHSKQEKRMLSPKRNPIKTHSK
ncbi:MAG: AAA family ATPase [Oscillibacter sp.]|nr:AAA family ATPase [Oscillibacter sp.]